MRSMLMPNRRRALRFAAVLFFAAVPIARAASYDVLYLWSADQASAAASKRKIADILGPDVGRRLRVISAGGRYGLVYQRRGRLDAVAAVARVHTRLLSKRGFSPAVPVIDENWDAPAHETKNETKIKTRIKIKPAALQSKSLAPVSAPAAVPFGTEIAEYIKHLRERGQVKPDENTAWAIYDLTDNEELLSINEEMLLQAASLVKPFIALAYFHEVASGNQQYTDTARKRMEEMIRASDNAAADWFMRLLGGPAAVQALLSKNYGDILRDLNLVEYIPLNGHTYLNKASVHDYSSFLRALWGESIPGAQEMKRLMNLPKRNRLYTGTQGVPAGTEVYDKTGTTSRLCGDMGILVARRNDGTKFPYIVIGLIQKTKPAGHYRDWMRKRGDIIRHVSELAYGEIAALHHFKDFNPFCAVSPADVVETDSACPDPEEDALFMDFAAIRAAGITFLDPNPAMNITVPWRTPVPYIVDAAR